MRHALVICAFTALAALPSSGLRAQGTSPSIDDVISLKRAGAPEISPDGKLVAYTVRETNWDQNQYETNIWIADVATGTNWRLTQAKKSSTNPVWSPDGSRILFASDRSDKRQLYVISPRGGEAEQITTLDEAPAAFAWSPDGATIAYVASEARSDADKD
ncbi:MAG: DPP IV N-terminal domain-containing protein, partial [Gemmatimonadota bacterium]|nr:DPP IV N-terminal domain-containing protein [Gemmatimonadota bacterium]